MSYEITITVPDCPQCGAQAERPTHTTTGLYLWLNGKAECGRAYSVAVGPHPAGEPVHYSVYSVVNCLERQLAATKKKLAMAIHS